VCCREVDCDVIDFLFWMPKCHVLRHFVVTADLAGRRRFIVKASILQAMHSFSSWLLSKDGKSF
jgi:hypothetical protein